MLQFYRLNGDEGREEKPMSGRVKEEDIRQHYHIAKILAGTAAVIKTAIKRRNQEKKLWGEGGNTRFSFGWKILCLSCFLRFPSSFRFLGNLDVFSPLVFFCFGSLFACFSGSVYTSLHWSIVISVKKILFSLAGQHRQSCQERKKKRHQSLLKLQPLYLTYFFCIAEYDEEGNGEGEGGGEKSWYFISISFSPTFFVLFVPHAFYLSVIHCTVSM